MPVKRNRGVKSETAGVKRQGNHATPRHRHINGNHNGNSGIHGLYERAKKRINAADIPEMINIVQNRASKMLHSGEAESRKIASQISLLVQMVKERLDNKRDLPWRTVAALTMAVIYFVGPFDFMPGFIPFSRYLDKAGVLAICFMLIRHDLKEYAVAEGLDLRAYGF